LRDLRGDGGDECRVSGRHTQLPSSAGKLT
jgi:hypothetical protein